MENQLDLFGHSPAEPTVAQHEAEQRAIEARARRSDPASSHAAADGMNASGAARLQRERVIDLVYRYPGRTSKELAALDGEIDRHAIARRLPEAEELGEVHRMADGAKELKWFPVRATE